MGADFSGSELIGMPLWHAAQRNSEIKTLPACVWLSG
jgi:hypothetical protein